MERDHDNNWKHPVHKSTPLKVLEWVFVYQKLYSVLSSTAHSSPDEPVSHPDFLK